MRPSRSMACVVVCLFFLSVLAFGAEVRKITQEDIEWGDPDTTVTSPAGHVGHRIDNTFKLSAPYVDPRTLDNTVDTATDCAAVTGKHTVVVPKGVTDNLALYHYYDAVGDPPTKQFSILDYRDGSTANVALNPGGYGNWWSSSTRAYYFTHYYSSETLTGGASALTRFIYHPIMDFFDGGEYTATRRTNIGTFNSYVNNHDRAQLTHYGFNTEQLGQGDVQATGGTLRAYGSGEGTSLSGQAKFLEGYVEQGHYVPRGTISANNSNVLTLTSDTSLQYLAKAGRFIVNTSKTTTGTCTVTYNSAVVTGVGTSWDNNDVGKYFKLDLDDKSFDDAPVTAGKWYRIASVDNTTQLNLWTAYTGVNAGVGAAFTIADGAVPTAFSITNKTITITPAGDSDFAVGDVIQMPPHWDTSVQGIVLGLKPKFDDKEIGHLGLNIQNRGTGRIKYGIIFSNPGTASVDFQYGIYFGTGVYDRGIDFQNGTYTGGKAITLKSDQYIYSADATNGIANYFYQEDVTGDWILVNNNGEKTFRSGVNGTKIGEGTATIRQTWNATTSVSDNTTITHGSGGTPTAVLCTSSVAGEMCSVIAIGATTFTVGLRKHDGTAGTAQTVYWMALR